MAEVATLAGAPARPAPARPAAVWTWATVISTLGALVLAAVLAPPAAASPDQGLAFLLFVGSSVHVASTGWLFTLREVRAFAATRRARYHVVPLVLVTGTGLAAAVLTPGAFAWLLLPFFSWQFFHFQKQNLGMVALTASSHRLPSLSAAARRTIVAAGVAGIAALVSRPGRLQLHVATRLGWLFPVAALGYAGVALYGTWLLLHRPPSARPRVFVLSYLAALLFFLPAFLFSSPYAAVAGMTIAHGLQYLLIVGVVAAGTTSRPTRLARVATLSNLALLGGAALAAASHLHTAAPPGRFLFGAYLGVVMSHFVVDAGLWRLRDDFPRSFLAAHAPYLLGRAAPSRAIPSTDRSVADI